MKILILSLGLFLMFNLAADTKRILLSHPTKEIISDLAFLIKEKIFPLRENFKILGFYNKKDKADFREAKRFIADHGIRYFELIYSDCLLDEKDIFRKNSCSEDFKELFRLSAGVIFPGGDDMPPTVYGKSPHLLSISANPMRNYFELSFMYHLFGNSKDSAFEPFLEKRKDYFVLGICLGAQTLNVANGGTLVQDVPTELYKLFRVADLSMLDPDMLHKNYLRLIFPLEKVEKGILHRIKFNGKKTSLIPFSDDKMANPLIYSSHHQAIDRLGEDFEINAVSMDEKIIEVISHKYFRVLGLQFHPEKQLLWDKKIKAILDPARKNNFHNEPAEILGKDSFSLDFHKKLWQVIAENLQN